MLRLLKLDYMTWNICKVYVLNAIITSHKLIGIKITINTPSYVPFAMGRKVKKDGKRYKKLRELRIKN